MDQQDTQTAPESAEPSVDDIISTLRGEDIADEVDKPPPKRAKSSQPAKEADTVAEEPEELEAATDDSDASGEDEEDEEVLGLGFLRKQAEAKAGKLQAQLEEMQARLAELEPKAKRGELDIGSLLDDDDAVASLTKEDKTAIIQRLFVELYPEKATAEDLADLERHKYTREQRKAQELLAKKEEEIRDRVQQSDQQRLVAEHYAEIGECIADNRDKYPALLDHFGSAKALAAAALRVTRYMAQNGAVESYEEVSPERILSLMEDEYSSKGSKPQKSAKSPSKARSKPVPVSEEMSGDSELEAMAAIMRGEG